MQTIAIQNLKTFDNLNILGYMAKRKKVRQRQIKKTDRLVETGTEIVGEKPLNQTFKNHLTSLLVLLVLTVGVYSNSLFNDFVYDDTVTITENLFVRDWENLPDLFSKTYFSRSGEETYRPVVTLSYFIDYTVWGLKPFGYHLTNVLLHSINVVLVYLLTIALFRDWRIGFLSAMLFAIHPVQSEAVNAISFREDLLVVFFLLPAFLLFLKITDHSSPVTGHSKRFFYFLSLLLYSLALFSKEMAVTFPLLLVLYHFCFRKDGEKENAINRQPASRDQQLIFYLTGYVAVTLMYLFFYFGFLSNPTPGPFKHPDLWIRFLNIPKVLIQYLCLILVPWTLNADYVMRPSHSLSEISVLFPIVILACLIAAAYFLFKKYGKEMFGLLWFFIVLFPVMNIIPIVHVLAERYLYLPFIGLSLFISSCLICLSKEIDRDRRIWFSSKFQTINIATTIVGLLIVVYTTRTFCRNFDWRDNFSLWSKTVVSSPHSSRAHYNLGNSFSGQEQWQMAIKEYRKTLKLKPNHPKVHNNLGIAYDRVGRQEDAIQEYNIALQLTPNDPDVLGNLGNIYFLASRYREAVQKYKKVIQLKPDDYKAHYNLGGVYYLQGSFENAAKEWNATLSIKPSHQGAKKHLEVLKKDRRLKAENREAVIN